MYGLKDYVQRGSVFLRNRLFPGKKKLSSLMIYATDLCDSACQHCQIWTKRPTVYLPKEKIFELISNSRCITKHTTIGLQGGEFMLHPEAMEILEWLHKHHPRFDLLSNCLKPDLLIEAVKRFPPQRLWISLDGDKETYLTMRGKDGYDSVLKVITTLKDLVPISVMFTLSPFNDFSDLEHVATVCKREGIDLRIGIYDDIAFFDTIEEAHETTIGARKKRKPRSFSEAKQLIELRKHTMETRETAPQTAAVGMRAQIPELIREFEENYDFLVLYDEWKKGGIQLSCNSIMESLVMLPNGDVPICQHQDVLIGNIYTNTLDEVFNGIDAQKKQKHFSKNCNACWINFHRKYDIILHRSMERYFGKFVTQKILGYYWWESERKKNYRQAVQS